MGITLLGIELVEPEAGTIPYGLAAMLLLYVVAAVLFDKFHD